MAAKKSKAKKKAKTLATPSTNENVNIKKISNGYLVSRSKETKSGYKLTEKYYKSRPKIKI